MWSVFVSQTSSLFLLSCTLYGLFELFVSMWCCCSSEYNTECCSLFDSTPRNPKTKQMTKEHDRNMQMQLKFRFLLLFFLLRKCCFCWFLFFIFFSSSIFALDWYKTPNRRYVSGWCTVSFCLRFISFRILFDSDHVFKAVCTLSHSNGETIL